MKKRKIIKVPVIASRRALGAFLEAASTRKEKGERLGFNFLSHGTLLPSKGGNHDNISFSEMDYIPCWILLPCYGPE